MSKRFDNQITIPNNSPVNLLQAMIAKGFTSTAMATFLAILPNDDLYMGNSNTVDASSGRLLKAFTNYPEPTGAGDIIDLTQIWIFSEVSTVIHVQCRGK